MYSASWIKILKSLGDEFDNKIIAFYPLSTILHYKSWWYKMKKVVRNLNGKKICEVDINAKEVIIKNKKFITIIKFNDKGMLEIKNFIE